MVLSHTTNHTYSHPFATVTLAYFLRYSSPKLNPFSTHVLSTDTIDSRLDPVTGRLHTTRIHLKKSRMPAPVFKLLPTSITGGGSSEKVSYVLENSVIDMREGWMRTESKNLSFMNVLSVVEKQDFRLPAEAADATTDVTTTFVYKSRLGERLRGGKKDQMPSAVGQPEQKEGRWMPGWMSGLGARGVQRSIESIASSKTQDQMGKSREGMRVVLERLRKNGVVGVLEMMRRERQLA
ncbi:PRELI-like family-domain-containing protein [Colletotrichum godetiae]|uniref:PRELI-like family-domain-containing protein n=1 Tax=Colletotrichum godetiae TaxID=1209918 RepID=A0AAJ0AJR3_9PEZI|nr:PRELI-like family-domain-containing protein [Colletotrichum godetiae]KAK1675169.1 PRELI-like family-domain-containing protein [Colletotrichum godetiae]